MLRFVILRFLLNIIPAIPIEMAILAIETTGLFLYIVERILILKVSNLTFVICGFNRFITSHIAFGGGGRWEGPEFN